jgi:hypothetical protein
MQAWSQYETAMFPVGSKSELTRSKMHRVEELQDAAGTPGLFREIRQAVDLMQFLQCAVV